MVSQKISKRAVIRNKVKRRLSDAIRAEIKNIKSGADVVFIALPGIEKKEFSEIKSTVENTIIKAGLFLK